MEPRNRFQGMNFASLCSLAGHYDKPIPTRFLAHIDCLKIPALCSGEEPNAIGRSLNFCYICIKNKVIGSNTSLNSAKYTITKKEYFSFLAQISCQDTATVVYTKSSISVCAPAIRGSGQAPLLPLSVLLLSRCSHVSILGSPHEGTFQYKFC
jgi:hypothetical protein